MQYLDKREADKTNPPQYIQHSCCSGQPPIEIVSILCVNITDFIQG